MLWKIQSVVFDPKAPRVSQINKAGETDGEPDYVAILVENGARFLDLSPWEGKVAAILVLITETANENQSWLREASRCDLSRTTFAPTVAEGGRCGWDSEWNQRLNTKQP